VDSRTAMEVLEEVQFCCSCRDSNPWSSSPYKSLYSVR